MLRRFAPLVVMAWGICLTGTSAQERLAAVFVEDRTPPALDVGSESVVSVRVRNAGLEPWRPAGLVRLSYHWATADGRVVARDGIRTELTRDVPPGGEVTLCAKVQAPAEPGNYQLQWDMVQDGVAWFSDINAASLHVRPVSVGSFAAPPTPAAVWRVAAVVGGAILHLALVTLWVWRRWRDRMLPEVAVFFAAVIGLGLLHAVLHTLLFTVGLSIPGSLAMIAALQAAMWTWHWRRPPVAPPNLQAPNDGDLRPVTANLRGSAFPTILAAAGAVILLALVLQWATAATSSPAVIGTDAGHYHVPHAVNFARGVSPFTFLATPHLYPMGTSVWAAWFIQAADGPVLIDLATLPAFLLIVMCFVALIRLLTGASGFAWAPWIVLVLFSSELVRLSVLMSADLFYAAACIALVTALLVVWTERRIDSHHVVVLALAAGMLVSTKNIGTFSLVVFAALWMVAVAAGRLRRVRIEWSPNAWALIAATLAFVASGGVWLWRNWWMFGSPVAPTGLQLFGWTVFQGQTYESTKLYRSVLEEMTKNPAYEPWRRLAESVTQMMGNWFLLLVLAGLLLVVDVVLGWRRIGMLHAHSRLKLGSGLFVAAAFVTHALVLAGAPWTSFEYTHALSVRFVLPFLALWPLMWYAALFSDAWPWHRHRVWQVAGGSAIALASVGLYATHQASPGLPSAAWFPVFSVQPVLFAAGLVGLGFAARRPRWRRLAMATLVVFSVGLTARYSWTAAAMQNRFTESARQSAASDSLCATGAGTSMWPFKGMYSRVAEYQRASGVSCGSTRFFMLSRFNQPVALQDPTFRNVVLDVARSEFDAALGRSGPQPGACDVVIVGDEDAERFGEAAMARQLHARGSLASIGGYAYYRAYVVR